MISYDTVKSFLTPDAYRAHVLPDMSRHYLLLENMIYDLAKQTCPQYKGGYWEMVRAPINGQIACFLYPDSTPDVVLAINSDNYFEGELSNVEFGIGLSLMALSHLSFMQGEHRAADSHRLLTDWMFANDPSDNLLAFID